MKSIYDTITTVFLSAICAFVLQAQESIKLDDVLQLVIENSFDVKQAANQKELAIENYNFYKSQLKPQLGLGADLPNYIKSSSPVIQPDGKISFQPIRQANSTISAFASQLIGSTGGTVFLNSDIQRFDDLSFNAKQYNGIPIRLGISQPILGFNPIKYEKTIQSQLLEQSALDYNINIEEALGNATSMYFAILVAEQNYQIAKTNKEVNEKLLNITEERLKLGKVSLDEKLQLEIELNNAQLSESAASFERVQAIANLYTFLNESIPNENTVFEVPEKLIFDEIRIDQLLQIYKSNRPEVIAFQRQMLENKLALAQAKSDYGFRANVEASIGLARGADKISTIYSDPFDEQQFNLSVFIPLLDGGRKKAALNQIKIQERNQKEIQNQLVNELENNIYLKARELERMQNEIQIIENIMHKAEERFSISNERYVLGNIDITNLTIAQREKDQTKRNYINSMMSYWSRYYELRALTGYDIIEQKEIQY